jgi:XTP/dITP diphosphohydrolase
MTGRLVLLTWSHRVAPGLLSFPAWEALRSASVAVGDPAHPLLPHLQAAGVHADVLDSSEPRRLARELRERAGAAGGLVWVQAADGDPDLVRALAELVAAEADRGATPLELEVLPGSWDVPGARFLDLVSVMDRLRSPGGCPWDREQTHASLVPYLLEEAYETVEAVETGDDTHLREELGDLLLQVVFHSRIAEEHAEGWSVDDVAGGIVEKLIRRHPHVFAGASADTAADVEASWEELKAAEKSRTSAVDGVPLAQPALALAAKLMHRAEKFGVPVSVSTPVAVPDTIDIDTIGDLLLAVVALARRHGVDPEAALRSAARRFRDRVQAAED